VVLVDGVSSRYFKILMVVAEVRRRRRRRVGGYHHRDHQERNHHPLHERRIPIPHQGGVVVPMIVNQLMMIMWILNQTGWIGVHMILRSVRSIMIENDRGRDNGESRNVNEIEMVMKIIMMRKSNCIVGGMKMTIRNTLMIVIAIVAVVEGMMIMVADIVNRVVVDTVGVHMWVLCMMKVVAAYTVAGSVGGMVMRRAIDQVDLLEIIGMLMMIIRIIKIP
jgi:hypothetical protein